MSTHQVTVAITQTQAVKKKTPSARVIAAKFILNIFGQPACGLPEPEEMTKLFGSRVNEAKRDKTHDQLAKITAKLVQRMQLVVDKFEGKAPPPKPRKPKKTAEPAASAEAAQSA